MLVNDYTSSNAVNAALAARNASTQSGTVGGSENDFINALVEKAIASMQENTAKPASSEDSSNSAGFLANAAQEAAQRARVTQKSDEVAYLAEVSIETKSVSAAEKKQAVMDKLNKLLESTPNAVVNIDPAVFEKMADDPDFEAKVDELVSKIENHPWFTEDIPGLVSRFVYIGADGECMVGFLREVSGNDEEEQEIEAMLAKLMEDREEEMHRILFEFGPDSAEKTPAELVQELIDEFIRQRQQELEEGLAEELAGEVLEGAIAV